MNAARLLETARAAGLSLVVDGENLIVEADRDPPAELIAELREHKAELMRVLSRRESNAALEPTETAVSPGPRQQHAPRGYPLLLRSGRRLYRFRVDRIPDTVPDQIKALMDEARWRRVVLVADGHDLIVVEPWLSTLAIETLQELEEKAAGLIAALRGQSRARTALLQYEVACADADIPP
jgi:hypothetical protein